LSFIVPPLLMVAWLMSLWDNNLPVFFGLSLFGLGSLAMQRSIGGKTHEIPPKGGTTNGLRKLPGQYIRLPISTRPSFCQIPPPSIPPRSRIFRVFASCDISRSPLPKTIYLHIFTLLRIFISLPRNDLRPEIINPQRFFLQLGQAFCYIHG
jgi:hypothetical protein